LGINKTVNEVRQRFYWLQAKAILKNGVESVAPVRPVAAHVSGIGVIFTSTTLGHRSKEQQLI
jgi:hypothetical protein